MKNNKNNEKMQKDEFEFSPRKRKAKNEKKINLKKITLISASVIIILCLGALGLGYSFINTHTVADGIFVGDMDLSGLTLSQTEQALDGFTLDKPYEIILQFEDNEYTLDTSDLYYTIDTQKTAKKAYDYGKNGNLFSKISKAISAKMKNINTLPVFVFDDTEISEKLNEFATESLGETIQHTVEVVNNEILITPGTSGYDNDPTEALSTLNYALESKMENVIKITFKTMLPELLTIDKLSQIVSADGLDAAFKIENGEVVITEGRSGYVFDEFEATEALATLHEGGEIVKIPCTPVAPKLSKEELQAKLFNAELASYSTRYNAGQVNRSKNVAVAASKLNNVIILPNETLSFNAIVGKRTEANGFKPAAEYQNGKSVTGIGGGTCQVSTTLYSAALYANLEIVSRRNHSMSVSYVPLGQDATVTDGGTDLKIKNNTSFPIKLKTSAGGGTVTVKIIGTEYEPKISVKIINTKTSDLSATTTRIVYDANGNEISRELISNSKYKPHEEETTAPAETPTPEATPVPEVSPEAPSSGNADNPSPSPEQTEAPTQTPKPEATSTPVPSEPAKTATPVNEPKQTEATPVKTAEPISEKTDNE